MRIQWFPGHMTKAMRMMSEQVAQVDCLICVLDCRAGRSSGLGKGLCRAR